MSSTDYASTSSVEVTHEDFQRHFGDKKRFRLRNLLPKKPSARNAFSTSSEIMSVTNLTVTSNETVRASNLSERPTKKNGSENQKSLATELSLGWGVIRTRLQGKKIDDRTESRNEDSAGDEGNASSTKMSPLRRRVLRDRSVRDKSKVAEERRIKMDDAIRGRMDGMDVLSLGPARLASIRRSQVLDDCDLFIETMNSKLTPSKMVSDMILTSAGRDPPEMVLEGFIPGGDDRWRVSMEEPLVPQQEPVVETTGRFSPIPALAPATSSDCGSSLSCTEDDLANFLGTIWGGEKTPPTHAPPQVEPVDDDVLQMASACNVPIDVDEEAFIVETGQHLRSVHDIASIYLRRQDFEGALTIFHKILKGLKLRHEDKPHFLIGATLHNIGVVQMWQGKFQEALQTLEQAVATRITVLPPAHPDIAVSLARQAFAQFALNRLKDSLDSFGRALELCPSKNATRAKILNNIGVVQYQAKHFVQALQGFAGALEIQRQWLEGPVRRESIIFDATTTLRNMGKIYLTKCDFGTSFDVYEEAMLVRKILPRLSVTLNSPNKIGSSSVVLLFVGIAHLRLRVSET